MQARDVAVAMTSTIAEAYNGGTFQAIPSQQGTYPDYLNTGGTIANTDLKYWDISVMGPSHMYYYRVVDELLGQDPKTASSKGFWLLGYFAPDEPSYTFFNAPMWIYCYFPEGYNVANNYYGGGTKPMTVVTYNMSGLTFDTRNGYTDIVFFDDVSYDPNGGYQVLQLTTANWGEVH
jgi:hypothetical protein